MDATGVEIVLGGDADAVPRARQFTAQALDDADPTVVGDAELIVSELVTNALLHGGTPVTLRLSRLPDRVRIEVEDTGRQMPMRVRDSIESMTGRGIGLVSALSADWGVDAAEGRGKVVWAELGETAVAELPTQGPGVDELLAAYDEGPVAADSFTVELGSVPTDLLLEAKAHIDNLVREFTLAEAAAAAPSGERLPPELAELVQTVVHGFRAARSSIKRQALEAAARGEPETKLTLTLPASAADAGEDYLAALDQADGYARAARLLTLETPPLHRIFRRWYVQALVDQLRSQVAGRPPSPVPTFQQRLAAEVAALMPLQQVARRLALLQRATAQLTGARDVEDVARVAVSSATDILGAQSARIYLLGEDRMLRSVTTSGAGPELTQHYEEFPADAALPGGEALRTGNTLVFRNLSELVEQFPALAGIYPEERIILVAPMAVGDHQLGVLSMTFRSRAPVDEETQLTLLTTLADVTAQALERALATTAATAAADRLAFLAEASVALSSTLDYRTVLSSVADLVVPRLADWCAIQLLERGELVTVALTHFDPAKARWAAELSERYPADMSASAGAPNVVRTGVSEVYPDIPPELLEAIAVDEDHLRALRELGMSSALIVPLTGRSGTLGALAMVQAESGRHYDEDDVAFAEDLARRAALAVETAHAFLEQSGRLAEVTRVAEAAQHAILAAPPSQIGPVALAARYVSAAAEALVGGDLFEVTERAGSVRLLIGDVRGKGLDAVRVATIVLGEFRAAAADIDDLAEVAIQIDRRLRRYLTDEDFVTATIAEIAHDGAFALVSCGHVPALLVAEGRVSELDVPTTLPLGLGAEPSIVSGRLSPGGRLFLYTDGLIEARDNRGRFLDLDRLVEPLHEGDLDAALDRVLLEVRGAVGGELADDLALLVAEYVGD